MLAQVDPDKILDIFLWKVVCGLWANIAQVIFSWQIKITLYMVIFLRKDHYVNWANIGPVIYLCNVVSSVFE